MRRSAYVEAITLLNAGNELLATLSQGPDRDQFELQLLVPLGMSYINSRRYAAPEVGNTFQRAHKLARNTANADQHYRALRGLWFFFQQRGQLRKAQSVAEDLLRFAQYHSDQAGMVEGYRILATTSFHVGKFPRSLQYVQQGPALYDATCHADGLKIAHDFVGVLLDDVVAVSLDTPGPDGGPCKPGFGLRGFVGKNFRG